MATNDPNHLPITTRKSLVINSHHPRDLVDAFVSSFREENTLVWHRGPFGDIFLWYEGFRRLLAASWPGSPSVLASLREGFRLMNTGFFMRGLSGVSLYFSQGLLRDHGAYGVTQGTGERVRIFLEPGPYTGRTGELARDFVGTMLHEMAHAVFHTFACRQKPCTCTRQREHEVERGKGHGNAWIDLAEAIEEASPWFFGCKLDLASRYYRRE